MATFDTVLQGGKQAVGTIGLVFGIGFLVVIVIGIVIWVFLHSF